MSFPCVSSPPSSLPPTTILSHLERTSVLPSMSDTSSPVFPESDLPSISSLEAIRFDDVGPPPPPPLLFPSLPPYVPYTSSFAHSIPSQNPFPFHSTLGLVSNPYAQPYAREHEERREVSATQGGRDASAEGSWQSKPRSEPLRFDAESPAVQPQIPQICVECQNRFVFPL